MKEKNFKYVLLFIFLIAIGFVWYSMSHIKTLTAPPKDDAPYTQDEPTEFPNGCGEGVTDCKG